MHNLDHPVIGCRSDGDPFELAITVLGAAKFAGELKASGDESAASRRELIAAVRSGQHVELHVTTRTFRQRDGNPNRRGLRFKPSILARVAASFAGMPVLLDHNTSEQSARIGTILSSELYAQNDWSGFRQVLSIVKPDAVISVLDGTLDRFSVGWIPTGPVLCSVHGNDVREHATRCCYPGERATADSGKPEIVEWEFQAADGIEVSAVNVPAVTGTKIEEIRSALDAEIGLDANENLSRVRADMAFPRLAAQLGLQALAASTDEDRALAVIETMRLGQLATAQERDVAVARAIKAESALTAVTEAAEKTRLDAEAKQVDALIALAYRNGQLLYARDAAGVAHPSPREERVRRIAKQDGLAAVEAELNEMGQIAPVNQRVITDEDRKPARTSAAAALANAARQLGHEPKALEDYAANNLRTVEES